MNASVPLPSSGRASPTADPRFPLLDLARIAAALLVVFFHWCFLFNIADATVAYKPWLELEPYARYGYLGVNLFFMISGFLIVQSARSKTARQFLRARAIRLYPAYLTCCALTYAVTCLATNSAPSAATFLYNMTMMNGVIDSVRNVPPTYVDGVYWTLTVEWQFYALMFVLVAAGQLGRIERFLWLWSIACLADLIHPARWLDVYLMASWGSYFIAGAAFYRGHASGWNASRAGLVTAAFGLCLEQAWRFAAVLGAVHAKTFDPVTIACAIALFFAFFGALPWLRVLPSGPLVATLGALSYPVYLLHQQIGGILIQRYWILSSRYALLAIGFIALMTIAAAVHFLVERKAWAVLRPRRVAALVSAS